MEVAYLPYAQLLRHNSRAQRSSSPELSRLRFVCIKQYSSVAQHRFSIACHKLAKILYLLVCKASDFGFDLT